MTKLNCYHWDFHGRKMSLLSVAQLGEGGENPSSPPSLDSIMIMIVDHIFYQILTQNVCMLLLMGITIHTFKVTKKTENLKNCIFIKKNINK